MTDDAQNMICDALEDLLDRERAALLAGDIEGLGRLADEKERLLTQVSGHEHTRLDGLQAKAARNQELLNSALEGIRAVASRLQALRDVRNTLNTYDQSGRRQSIEGLTRPQVERRA
ncbi:flagellar biosynthesis protein FlgN [Lacimonas salitolerans]|uniref:Flagellar biosynthesis protein FlgN n=1 Tax=Lacimonas salitolerans TaxID=1323750 RepID=A0ABW4EJF5_9RHOB